MRNTTTKRDLILVGSLSNSQESLSTLNNLTYTLFSLVAVFKWSKRCFINAKRFSKGNVTWEEIVIKIITSNKYIKHNRVSLFSREKLLDDCNHIPLLAYLEVLPSMLYVENHEDMIVKSLDNIDGSLFQSPSATASAFMITRNAKCLAYLRNVVHRFPNGGKI